jgi:alkanesulfonate monooxygenase SsuD/methylene tetrahydromethanopterin reductase-like flavin-dependent oxidoreductase (luciferase family)
MIGGGFIATGSTQQQVDAAREDARYRIAFYASTRTYLPVLEHHGWEEINPQLRALIAENRWDDLPTVVSDDILDGFCISGTYETIASKVRERYEMLVDVVSLSMPEEPSEQFTRALRDIQLIPGSREVPPAM